MAETTVAERPADEAAPTRRARSRRSTAILVAVGVIGVAALGWLISAWSVLGSVRIVYDAVPIACSGGAVTVDPPMTDDVVGFDEAFRSPVVEVAPGMTCGLRLHVVNDGWADVEVRTVLVPGMQEEFASLVRPTMVNPNGQVRLADTEDAAVFDISGGMTVGAGERQVFTVVLEPDEADADLYEQCSMHMSSSPEAVVWSLGLPRTVPSPDDDGIWFSDGPRDDCR